MELKRFYDPKTELWGLINTAGEVVVPAKYEWVGDFHNGIARVQELKPYRWGVINTAGELVVPCKYKCVWDFHDGLARVQDARCRYTLINTAGEEVADPEKVEWLAKLPQEPCLAGANAFLRWQGSIASYFTQHPRGAKDRKWCEDLGVEIPT